jgi:hypothetical protein
MESADIVLWRRQGPCGSWLLPFVEHGVGLCKLNKGVVLWKLMICAITNLSSVMP